MTRSGMSSLVLLMAAALTGCGAGAEPGIPDAEVSIVPGAVAQGSAGFTPNPLVRNLADGARVIWRNDDWYVNPAGGITGGTPHHLISDDGLFESGSVAPRKSFSFVFPGPGTYRYRCLNHPTMIGSVTIEP